MPRTLVCRGGALGDFVVTLPLLRALTRHGHTVELIGNAQAAELALITGDLTAIHRSDAPRWYPLFGYERLPEELQAWLEGFDFIFAFWPDPEGTVARHLARLRGPRCHCLPAHPHLAPAARHFGEALTLADVPPPADWQSDLRHFRTSSSERIFLHPGSGSPRKNWPLEHWCALVDRLAEPVDILLGEAEATQAAVWRHRGVVHQPESPVALAWRLGQGRLFLGHDTGVAHVAAAVGLPCCLLFGPTDPDLWAPPQARPHVVRTEDLRTLTVEAVIDALKRLAPNLRWR